MGFKKAMKKLGKGIVKVAEASHEARLDRHLCPGLRCHLHGHRMDGGRFNGTVTVVSISGDKVEVLTLYGDRIIIRRSSISTVQRLEDCPF